MHLYNCVIGREDSAQLPLEDAMVHGKVINCIPRGTMAIDQLLTEEERKQPIPGKTGHLDREGSFRHHPRCHSDLQCELCSQGEWKWKHFWSVRGMWHFWVPGAHDILSARGMSFSDHKTMTSVIGSSQVWISSFLLFLLPQSPLLTIVGAPCNDS